MKNRTLAYVLSTCLALGLLSCQTDTFQPLASGSSNPPPAPGTSILSSICDLSIHMDMETYSFTRPKNGTPSEELNGLDRSAGIPNIQRLDIQVCKNFNGNNEWFIQNLEPEMEIPTNHESPPDDSPDFSHAYISNNNIQLFNTDGQLMSGESMDLPDFNQFLNLAPGNRELLWEQAVVEAREQGIVLDEVEDEFLDLKKVNQQSGETTVIMLDLINKVMIGTSIFDSNGLLKTSVTFEWDQGGESPVLSSVHQVMHEKSLSSGLDMIYESYTTFHTFIFQKNT